MLPKQEVVAMLLAGGQGSRLGVLTRNLAKPAVPFGGKYRIIDFPLSNCVNSGIETVGVLTQYQPLELNDYIGNGQPWDLDSNTAGVHVLPPYQKQKKTDWYKGTANAIYQNIPFIERYNPDYVVVLSGDHIYKMDYSKMLSFHKEKNAACTIAVYEVPMAEASRFGILNTNEDGSIYEFDEKPKKPKSNKASMGIYVFTWEKLRKYLEEDENDPKSQNDFGKNVLPAMLNAGEAMYAYRFEGLLEGRGHHRQPVGVQHGPAGSQRAFGSERSRVAHLLPQPGYAAPLCGQGSHYPELPGGGGLQRLRHSGLLGAVRRRLCGPRRGGAGFHHHARRPH